MPERRSVPRTMEQLVANYDRYITGCIYRISRGHVRPDDMEDLRQQILLRVHESKYLQKYDATRCAFGTYLYWLIRSVVVNQFEKNTRNPVNAAIGLVESVADDDGQSVDRHNYLVLESYRDAVDDSFERIAMAKDLADRFEAHLSKTSKPWGPPICVEGQHTRRSLALVFALQRRGFEARDVAKALFVSPQAAFGYLKRVRVAAMQFSPHGLPATV